MHTVEEFHFLDSVNDEYDLPEIGVLLRFFKSCPYSLSRRSPCDRVTHSESGRSDHLSLPTALAKPVVAGH